jgi:hypothetical protein
VGDRPPERVAVEGELDEGDVPDPVGEARPRELDRLVDGEGAEREVVLGLEGESRRLSDAAQLDGVLVGCAVRSARVGRVRDLGEEGVAPRRRRGEGLLGES